MTHTFHAERFEFCHPIAKSLRAQRLNSKSVKTFKRPARREENLGGGYIDAFDLFYIVPVLTHSMNDAQLEEYSFSASSRS